MKVSDIASALQAMLDQWLGDDVVQCESALREGGWLAV